jgi:hypothetical protein
MRNAFEKVLSQIGSVYHVNACPDALCAAVREAGFPVSALDGIYAGREGRTVHELSPAVRLVHTWYRMESGRYEVVCYLA